MHSAVLLRNTFLQNFKLCYCNTIKVRRRIHNVGLIDIPRVSVSDIKKLLRQKGFSVQDGCTSIITKCSVCASKEGDVDSKIFINKTTGKLKSTCSFVIFLNSSTPGQAVSSR